MKSINIKTIIAAAAIITAAAVCFAAGTAGNVFASEKKTAVKIIKNTAESSSLSAGDLSTEGTCWEEQPAAAIVAEPAGISGSGLKESSGLEIDKVNVPDSADVLVTLMGSKDSDSGVLNVYKKQADASGASGWTLALSTDAKLGKNGLYKTVEGDCKTPVGIFRMNTPFGRGDKLKGFPDNFLKVGADQYWNGDSDSALYNKMVDASVYTGFDKSKSEHIIDYGAYYNYCIDTGYNPEGTPHKGSAIFVHCMVNGENTHGCIAIPEADMISIMRLYEEGNTYIAIYDSADIGAMY